MRGEADSIQLRAHRSLNPRISGVRTNRLLIQTLDNPSPHQRARWDSPLLGRLAQLLKSTCRHPQVVEKRRLLSRPVPEERGGQLDRPSGGPAGGVPSNSSASGTWNDARPSSSSDSAIAKVSFGVLAQRSATRACCASRSTGMYSTRHDRPQGCRHAPQRRSFVASPQAEVQDRAGPGVGVAEERGHPGVGRGAQGPMLRRQRSRPRRLSRTRETDRREQRRHGPGPGAAEAAAS